MNYGVQIGVSISVICRHYILKGDILMLYKDDDAYYGSGSFFKAYKLKEGDVISVEEVKDDTK